MFRREVEEIKELLLSEPIFEMGVSYLEEEFSRFSIQDNSGCYFLLSQDFNSDADSILFNESKGCEFSYRGYFRLVCVFDQCVDGDKVVARLVKLITSGQGNVKILSAATNTAAIFKNETGKDIPRNSIYAVRIRFEISNRSGFKCEEGLCRENCCL